jgi:hypothetical protein
LLVGFGIVFGLTAFGALQGVFYGLILPPIFRRPVDRALSIRSRLRTTPDQVLPQLYNTYNRHSDANCILPHLALNLPRNQQPQARMVAAHYMLSTNPDQAERAIAVITDTLDAQTEWRFIA